MSHRTKLTLGLILLLIIGGGLFWFWNAWTGTFNFGAEEIFGCQNSQAIASTVGRAGTNLVSYNLFAHDISVNEMITPFLDNVQKQVKALKTGYSFEDIQTFNLRSKRGGGGRSLHSYAIAIDINPLRNPDGSPQTDIPRSIINVFRQNGFQWGGEWNMEPDPMHFEWYGAQIGGSFLDAQSGQIITNDINAKIDNSGIPVYDGNYLITLDSINPHKFFVTAKGYESTQFNFNLTCFQNRQLNIMLKPLPKNTPGVISGKVSFPNNRPLLISATIYLDGKQAGMSNVNGEYLISNVRQGKHKITAQILMFPGVTISTPKMTPGENLRNINITIGK